jgi:hypothetical protein
MKNNLLIFGTKDFNNSLDQIKEDLDFSFTYFNQNKFLNDQVSLSSAIIVDSQICENITILSTINKIINKPILLLVTKNLSVNCKHDGKNYLPINFIELKSKIINTITSYRFNKNSSIIIKNFILDKNEKKLKQDNLFITITEREVQFIELIFNEKRPLTKNIVLKKIWKYAENADTHTVETHVYRLRKKIFDKFKEKNFITNSKLGYSI